MFKRRRFGRHETEQDFELNLASIIDCLTVLIAFLLISTSFVSIGILDAEIAAAGAEAMEDTSKSPVSLTIDLKSNRSFVLHLSGQSNKEHSISPASGKKEPNYDSLSEKLAEIKARWPMLNSAVLVADNSVDYRNVVKAMEVARKTLPSINLGGF